MKALTAISIAIGVLASSLAQAQTQSPLEKYTPTTDLGLAPQNEVRSLTLALNPKDLAAMESYAASTVDPASPNFHNFLTPEQVGARFGQDAVSLAQVVNFLQAQGLSINKVYSDNLFISVSGTNAQLAAVFGSPIHVYQSAGQTYEAPVNTEVVPGQLAGIVNGVIGLSTQPLVRSNAVQQPAAAIPLNEASTAPNAIPTPNAPATGVPGSYTTADLANIYNIKPLYSAGITGAGKTIGITTLASYNQSDAYAYWAALGLPVRQGRITDVLVDNGAIAGYGPGSEGAGETTLDVEQAGGVAPGADMRVYIAPNSAQGFIDAFVVPIHENLVDTLSISWGSAEITKSAATRNAVHTALLQAAIQGIPVIAASGDAGAYDINRSGYTYPSCNTLLSVDYPASEPLVLAAGGTTLPYTQSRTYGTITVPQERAWAWDYLRDYMVKNYGQTFYYANFFPVGGGGGVSVYFGRPSYQSGMTGMVNSSPGQSLLCQGKVLGPQYSQTTYYSLINLPANVAGRNLPDVSLNADPYSGYSVYANGAWSTGSGGTSFVAPQLNGIFTLIAAGKGGRLGQLQPQLYSSFKTYGYRAGSPFRPISAGTDFFYSSKSDFNPATGLGAIDVANLARAMGVSL